MFIGLNVIIAPLVVYYAHRKFNKGIDFSYSISSLKWFELHFSVYFFSLLLMIFCSVISNAVNDVTLLSGVKRWSYIFLQQGGGVVFVMVLSSLLYKLLLYSGDLDFAMGYSVNMCKLFFSVVCISCALLFRWMWKVQGANGDFEISQLVMWIVVFVQIWIGFGTGCEGRIAVKSKKSDMWRNKRYYSCYLFSIIAPAICLQALLKYGEKAKWMMGFGGTILIQLFILLGAVVCFFIYSNPNKIDSCIRAYFLVRRLFKRKKVYSSHYRGLAYDAWIEDDVLHVIVWGRKVVNIAAGFTRNEKKEIRKGIEENIGSTNFGNMQEKKQEEVRKLLIEFLETIYEKRRGLMRSTFDKARLYFEESARVARK